MKCSLDLGGAFSVVNSKAAIQVRFAPTERATVQARETVGDFEREEENGQLNKAVASGWENISGVMNLGKERSKVGSVSSKKDEMRPPNCKSWQQLRAERGWVLQARFANVIPSSERRQAPCSA